MGDPAAVIDEPPASASVTRLVRSVEAVLAADGNGARTAAANRMADAAVSLTRHADSDPIAAELDQLLRDIRDGRVCESDDADPVTLAAFLAGRIVEPPQPPEPTSMLERLRARLLSAADVEHLPAPEWLLDGFIVRNSLGVMFGRPGGGKTHTLLDWSASIASGSWWFGHEVRKGRVLYIAAEGLAGLGKRVRGWKSARRVDQLDGLTFMAGAVNLLSLPDVIALTTVAVELRPDLTVIDTLGRSMAGGDENGPKDMGLVVEHLDQLRTATGGAVWVAHHATKADGTLRGHTALEGAADTVVECKGSDNALTLTVTKQKDDRRAPPLRLFLVPSLESVVLADRPGPGGDGALTDQARLVLDVLAKGSLDDGLSTTEWFNLCLDQSVSRSAFYNHRRDLVSTGLVQACGTEKRIRYKPATSIIIEQAEDF